MKLRWITVAGSRDLLCDGHPILAQRPASRSAHALWVIRVPMDLDGGRVGGWEWATYYAAGLIEPPEFSRMPDVKAYVADHLGEILAFAARHNETGVPFASTEFLAAWEVNAAKWNIPVATRVKATPRAPLTSTEERIVTDLAALPPDRMRAVVTAARRAARR